MQQPIVLVCCALLLVASVFPVPLLALSCHFRRDNKAVPVSWWFALKHSGGTQYEFYYPTSSSEIAGPILDKDVNKLLNLHRTEEESDDVAQIWLNDAARPFSLPPKLGPVANDKTFYNSHSKFLISINTKSGDGFMLRHTFPGAPFSKHQVPVDDVTFSQHIFCFNFDKVEDILPAIIFAPRLAHMNSLMIKRYDTDSVVKHLVNLKEGSEQKDRMNKCITEWKTAVKKVMKFGTDPDLQPELEDSYESFKRDVQKWVKTTGRTTSNDQSKLERDMVEMLLNNYPSPKELENCWTKTPGTYTGHSGNFRWTFYSSVTLPHNTHTGRNALQLDLTRLWAFPDPYILLSMDLGSQLCHGGDSGRRMPTFIADPGKWGLYRYSSLTDTHKNPVSPATHEKLAWTLKNDVDNFCVNDLNHSGTNLPRGGGFLCLQSKGLVAKFQNKVQLWTLQDTRFYANSRRTTKSPPVWDLRTTKTMIDGSLDGFSDFHDSIVKYTNELLGHMHVVQKRVTPEKRGDVSEVEDEDEDELVKRELISKKLVLPSSKLLRKNLPASPSARRWSKNVGASPQKISARLRSQSKGSAVKTDEN